MRSGTEQLMDTDVLIGLSEEEADKRLNEYGANKLTGSKSRSLLQRIFAQINNVLIYVLIVAAVISGMLGEVADSIIIGLVSLSLMPLWGSSRNRKQRKRFKR